MTSKIIRFIRWYCYFKIILHSIYRFPFIKEVWNDQCLFFKIVEQQAKLLLHLCVQTRTDCFIWPVSSLHPCEILSVQFATNCGNQSVLTDLYQKSFQVLVLKMLNFCYPGLNKVTLVNQLSLLLVCKTAIGETWNAANINPSCAIVTRMKFKSIPPPFAISPT